MRKKRIHGILAAALLATSLFSAPVAHASGGIGSEVKIGGQNVEPNISAGMDIGKNYAVWMDKDDEDQAVIIYDRSSGNEEKVADNGNSKSYLKVAGDYAVWLEESDNRKVIFLYDISKKKTTQITDETAVPEELDFDGETIVWTDKRDGKSNIYAYQLANEAEQKITTSNKATMPTVSKAYVAWQDDRNGNPDIYYYDLTLNKEKQATTNTYAQENPSIDKGVIVYEDKRKGISNIYSYDISDHDETAITNEDDDSTNPKIYDDYVVFQQDGELNYYNLKSKKSNSFSEDFYSKSIPAIYNYDVLYVTRVDNKLQMNLYDLKKEENQRFGSHIGDPSHPDASENYVVFVNEGDQNEIVLYDIATTNLKVISGEDQDPSHPVVSNSYAVWYDDEENALFSYNTKTQTMKQVTKSSEEPSSSLFAIDGANLIWVDEADDLMLKVTNLTTGKTREIDSTGDDILSVDINGNRILWLTDEGSGNQIYYYDLTKDDEAYSVRDDEVEIGDVQLTDDYIVWSEKGDDWDIYYYDFDRDRIYSLLRTTDKDQVRPQASQNFVMYETNQYNRDNRFEYQFYDIDELEFSDIYFSEDADPSQVRLGGNRIVWVDNRDEEPALYTMAFAEPKGDDGSDPGNGTGRYTFEELVDSDQLADVLLNNDADKVEFIFYEGTSKEVKYTFDDLVNDDSGAIIDLFLAVPFDEIIVQVL